MVPIPADLKDKAIEVCSKFRTYNDSNWSDFVAEALAAERQRCLDICAAEREWGDFHPDDVTKRIEKGLGERQIPGWNCMGED